MKLIPDFILNIFRKKPMTAPVPPQPRVITSPGWSFSVLVDGDDLVVNNARATCFGGANDPQDNGRTASGISTIPPGTLGCALPVVTRDASGRLHAPTAGSPLATTPRIPWKTPVHITCGGKTIIVPLIDNGPAKYTGNPIDLTVAAARMFDPKATAKSFSAVVSFRIPGGAKFVA